MGVEHSECWEWLGEKGCRERSLDQGGPYRPAHLGLGGTVFSKILLPGSILIDSALGYRLGIRFLKVSHW